MKVIKSVDEVNVNNIYPMLEKAGEISEAEKLLKVEVTSCFDVFESTICKFTATIACVDTKTPKTRKLLIKLTKPGVTSNTLGKQETWFYKHLNDPEITSIKPISMAICEASGIYHILFDDLSDTHEQSVWPLPVSEQGCLAGAGVLAKVHAHFSTKVPSLRDNEFITSAFSKLLSAPEVPLNNFLGDVKDILSEADQNLVRISYYGYIENRENIHNSIDEVTLVHGDPHLWNLLFPKNYSTHQTVLLDWQSWRLDHPVYDLLYLTLIDWHPSQRSQHLKKMLIEYCEQYTHTCGEPLDPNELFKQYREKLKTMMFFVVYLHSIGCIPAIWWNFMHKTFLAFEQYEISL